MGVPITLILDDFHALLAASPDLITRYEREEQDFPEAFLHWLKQVENTLKKHELPEMASISALRANFLATRNGALDPSLLVQVGRIQNRHKILRAVCALLFIRAQEILLGINASLSARRVEALQYLQQMVMLVDQQGGLGSSLVVSRSEALVRLFLSMRSNPGTSTAARHVLSLVTLADALRLLDEVLSDWELQP